MLLLISSPSKIDVRTYPSILFIISVLPPNLERGVFDFLIERLEDFAVERVGANCSTEETTIALGNLGGGGCKTKEVYEKIKK